MQAHAYEDRLVVLERVLEELQVASVEFEDVELGAERGGLGVLANELLLSLLKVALLCPVLRAVAEDVRVRVEHLARVGQPRLARVRHLALQRVRLRAQQHLLLVQLQDVVQVQLPREEELYLRTSSGLQCVRVHVRSITFA